jgi:hypothetical protein
MDAMFSAEMICAAVLKLLKFKHRYKKRNKMLHQSIRRKQTKQNKTKQNKTKQNKTLPLQHEENI